MHHQFTKLSLRFKAAIIITSFILISLVANFIDVGTSSSANEISTMKRNEEIKSIPATKIKILKPNSLFKELKTTPTTVVLEKDEPSRNIFSSVSSHPIPAEYHPDLSRTEDGEYFISHYSEIVRSIYRKHVINKDALSGNRQSIGVIERFNFSYASSAVTELKLCAITKKNFAEISNSQCRYQTSCFWHYAHKKCYEIPGLFHPFLPGETGSDELHCPGKYNNSKKSWKPPGYWTESHGISFPRFTKKTPTFFNSPLPSTSQLTPAEYLQKVYDRFHFGTSWLFREWKYWEPHPKQVEISDDDVDENNLDSPEVVMKGSHRPEYENLYVLDNFCVEPFGGVSGYFSPNASTFVGDPQNLVRPYRGKCDTRNSYHQEDSFKEFVQSDWITRLHFPPKYFDQRLVLFLRVRPTSRFHPAHVLNHFMSALGILRVAKAKNLHPSGISEDNDVLVPPPLIMFVNEHRSVEHDTKAPHAWAYFYQLLADFPWAVVTTGFDSPLESQKYGVKVFEKMFNHSSPAEFWNRVRHGLGESNRQMFRVCFKRGILYQNCYDCGHSGAFNVIDKEKDYEKESYSFGMWAPATEQRISLIDEYRNLVTRCLTKPYADDENTNNHNNNKYRLPRVYFALRTKTRNVRDFSHMYQMFESTLLHGSSNFFPQSIESITYGEPGHGSRPVYLNDVRQNGDIFIGVHGGDVAMTALMPKRGVVLEFTFPTACCAWKEGQPTEPHDHERARRCWLGILVNGSRSDHWVYETRFPGVRNLVTLAPHYFTDAIRDASCRWMFKKYGKDEEIQKKLKAFDPSFLLEEERRTMKNKIAQVVAAMWSCLYQHAQASTHARENTVPEFHQIYKLTHLRSHFHGFAVPDRVSEYVNSSSNLARYFRFLWFGMTPGNVDLLATPQLQRQSEMFLSNMLAKGYQASFVPEFRCYQSSSSAENNSNNDHSCAIFWTLIMGRMLELADFNDRNYISENEEFQVSNKFGSSHQMVADCSKEFIASAINQHDGSFKEQQPTVIFQSDLIEYIGCLPTHDEGSKQFSCLYRIAEKK